MLRKAVENSIPEGTKRIAVWASGGIDSSALLYYLRDYDVEGIHVYFREGARSKLLFEGVTEYLGLKGHSHLMTLRDHFQLLSRALVNHEGAMSAFPTMLLFMARASMDYDLILHGLGLDELLGGYRQHAEASDQDFLKVENKFYNELPMRVYNTERQALALGLNIAAPFIDEELRVFCQALPRSKKAFMWATKIILRDIMRDRIPRTNRMDGYFAGSKEGFHPPLREWWEEGLGEGTMSHLSWWERRRLKGMLWKMLMRANEKERKKIMSEKFYCELRRKYSGES